MRPITIRIETGRDRARHAVAASAAVLAVLLLAGCAGASRDPAPIAPPRVESLAPTSPDEERYGIRYQSLRLSGSGLLLDLRYRVLDPARAAQLINRQVQPYVEDPATGHQFQVPHAPKVGTLRHMGQKLQAGRVYSMLFANPGRTIQSGAKVNVVLGAYRLQAMPVE